MNTHKKMLRNQRLAREWLESRGFKVWFIHHTRYQKDIWGLFDGIAIHKDGVAMVQVKGHSLPPVRDFVVFSRAFPSVSVLLMAQRRKGFYIKELREGRIYTVVA